MKALSGTDLRRACLVPSSVFTSPEEVVASARLSLAQKLTILRRWEFDARRVAGFASSESQAAGLLQQVRRALQACIPDPRPAFGC